MRLPTISGLKTNKINKTSLTKAELVGVDDVIGFVKLTNRLYIQRQRLSNCLLVKESRGEELAKQGNTGTTEMVKGETRVCIKKKKHHQRQILSYNRQSNILSDKADNNRILIIEKSLYGTLFRRNLNTMMGVTSKVVGKYPLAT